MASGSVLFDTYKLVLGFHYIKNCTYYIALDLIDCEIFIVAVKIR
jgi:hypothetical protein